MFTEPTITFVAALLAFLASVIAASVSAYNARLTKFAQQQWWERKADAYERIIDSLADLAYNYEYDLDAYDEGRDVPAARKAEIGEHYWKVRADLKKATAVGAFLISSDTEAVLNRMWKEMGKNQNSADWHSSLDSNCFTAKECLKFVVK